MLVLPVITDPFCDDGDNSPLSRPSFSDYLFFSILLSRPLEDGALGVAAHVSTSVLVHARYSRTLGRDPGHRLLLPLDRKAVLCRLCTLYGGVEEHELFEGSESGKDN